jgi:NhaP-type Na+/H+ or K+/H+ antiporter
LGTKANIIQSIPGLLILAVIALVGMMASKYLPGGIPAAAYVVTIGCILTIPGFPGSDIINTYVKSVGFVALCTPILAYAGVAIGKDLDAFAKSGWRICVLAIVVFVGTYIASAIIAQAILKSLGQI